MKTKIVEKIYEILSLVFIFLAPIVVVPLFADPYDFGRTIFVLAFGFVLFGLYCARAVLEKKLSVGRNSYFSVFFILFGLTIVSALVNSPNKFASLFTPLGAFGFFLVITTIFLVGNTGKLRQALYCLLGSGVLLSLISLILFLGRFSYPLNFPSLGISLTRAWSPTGSLISQVILLLALIPLGLGLISEALAEKKTVRAGIIFLGNVIILAGVGVGIWLLTNEAKPALLPQQIAWAIAAEGMKNWRLALWGVGPGRFLNAFTSFRPLVFNNYDFWNSRFGISSNWYFNLLTEVGLVAFLVYLTLVFRVFRKGWQALREPKISPVKLGLYLSLIILFLAEFFVPINFSVLVFLAILFGLLGVEEEKVSFDLAPLGGLVWAFLAIPLAIWGVVIFYGTKLAMGSYFFLDSAKAVAQNDGIRTYNSQIKAIKADGKNVGYRIAYSQTNFALANSLASKENLTDNDRNTITQLVQQAIREAKAAVALDPGNPIAWENLSSLYRNLINFAEGADQWAIASYQEAIRLDPINPLLRIDLGGIYYSKKDFNQAAGLFLQATNLKPDFANAYYNLANAYRELGAFAEAKRAYEITKSLVKIDSNDYKKVEAELREVEKKLPSPTPTPTAQQPVKPETLTKPEPPKAEVSPKLELPEEGPPITPSPTPGQ